MTADPRRNGHVRLLPAADPERYLQREARKSRGSRRRWAVVKPRRLARRLRALIVGPTLGDDIGET